MNMTTRTAIVIGSGVGGLATAIRLAAKGYAVTVLEKNARPGGKLGLIERDGYRFDTGPSLFTQPANIEELFRVAGVPMEDFFSYRRVDIACRYFYENGKRIDAHARPEDFARELATVAGEDPQAVLRYLQESARVYEGVGRIFLEHSLHKASTWLHGRTFKALRQVGMGHLLSTLDGFNRARLRSPEAVQLFNRYATYNGSDPFQAPGMLSLIPHLEQNEGTFYPRGGMISIPEALYGLASRLGVAFRFNTRVDRILHQDGRVTGVEAGGETLSSGIVVSNMDVYYTWRDLLRDARRANRVLRRERSSSALIFYWGVAREYPQLHLHNIFFSRDYAAEFAHIFRLSKAYPDPTVYINITSKMEAGQAPPGKENWFVMVNVPAGAVLSDAETRGEMRTAVLTKLERMLGTPIAPHIETEDNLTPEGIESDTHSYMGSLYGTSSNSRWAAFLRHANSTSGIRGLYFTGGSVHPGGGIPLCLKSARIVDGMIPSEAG
jgi:phytoene desaturase